MGGSACKTLIKQLLQGSSRRSLRRLESFNHKRCFKKISKNWTSPDFSAKTAGNFNNLAIFEKFEQIPVKSWKLEQIFWEESSRTFKNYNWAAENVSIFSLTFPFREEFLDLGREERWLYGEPPAYLDTGWTGEGSPPPSLLNLFPTRKNFAHANRKRKR